MEASSSTATFPNSASPAPAMKLQGLQGGPGEDSYANNSKAQNYMFHRYAKAHLSQALDHVFSTFFSNSAPLEDILQHWHDFRVADLGCSHGPNTLDYAHFIVQGMQKRLHTHNVVSTPSLDAGNCASTAPVRRQTEHFEMQYLFSDLPGNDFNALFQSLCPLGPQLQDGLLVGTENEKTDSDAPCARPGLQMSVFAAGVPGSFHGRLFPKESLHLVVCAFSLHWLSQVPPSVVDKSSPAWNGGNVWIHGGRPKVVEAYAQQFQEDAKAFLKSRAQELVKGGILFIFAISRSQEHPPGFFLDIKDGNDFWMGDFQSTWQEMVHEGIITQEEMDTFNVPKYNFHRNELEVALQSLVEDLEVINIDVLKECDIVPHQLVQKLGRNPEAFGKTWATLIASLIKPLVQAHLGEIRTEELFTRLHRMASKRANSTAKSIATPSFDTIIATIRRR